MGVLLALAKQLRFSGAMPPLLAYAKIVPTALKVTLKLEIYPLVVKNLALEASRGAR